MALSVADLEILQAVQELTGISANLNSILNGQAQSQILSQLIDEVQSVEELLLNANRGLQAIVNNQEQILININQSTSTVLQRVGNPQQANQPVTLPNNPPASFTAAIALANWGAVEPDTGNTYGALLAQCGYLAYPLASSIVAWKLSEWPYLRVLGLAQYPGGPTPNPYGGLPLIDPTTILPTDLTLLDWLQREYSAWSWQRGTGGNLAVTIPNVSPDGFTYECTITPEQFLQFQSFNAPTKPITIPPVWPGIANVTLGTAVNLAPTLVVSGPMHGVIIEITAVPNPIGYYDIGGDKSFVKVGQITFQDDNGNDELAQPLGFASNIVVPRMMTEASKALIRTQSGTTGTVTPFTIN